MFNQSNIYIPFLLYCSIFIPRAIYSQDCLHLVTSLDQLSTNPTYNSYELPASYVLEQGDSLILSAPCSAYQQVKEISISRTLAESRNYFLFRVNNKLEGKTDFFIEVENSHNNLVGLYSKSANGWQSTYLSGDRINQNLRNYDHRSVIFPIIIKENETRDFIIMIDMVNSSYALPLRVWEKEAFHQSDYRKNLVFGAYLGSVLLIVIFVILSLLFLDRRRLFFYYLMYLLCTTLFVLSDLGFADQFLWPNSFRYDEPMTFIAIFGSTSFFLLFASELLRIRELSPRLILFRNIFLGLVVIELILLLSPLLEIPSVFIFFFDFALYLIFAGMVLALIFGIVAIKNKRPLSPYFLLAFSTYIIGSALKPLSLKEIIPYSFGAQYGVLIGQSIEVIILSLLLVYQAWNTLLEKQELTKTLILKDKESYQLLAKGEYGERKRLATIIHDGISPKLAYLTMKLSSLSGDKANGMKEEAITDVISDIKEVSSDLRNLSRSISPIELVEKGLRNAVQDLVGKIENSSDVKITLDYTERLNYDSALLNVKQEAIFFTLNELLQNIITHNDASKIEISLKMNTPEYHLTVKDDGFPIPATGKTNGIGIKNIESRANGHNGSFLQRRTSTGNEQVFTIAS